MRTRSINFTFKNFLYFNLYLFFGNVNKHELMDLIIIVKALKKKKCDLQLKKYLVISIAALRQ